MGALSFGGEKCIFGRFSVSAGGILDIINIQDDKERGDADECQHDFLPVSGGGPDVVPGMGFDHA